MSMALTLAGDAGYALSIAVLVSFAYLVALRVVDLNEREPLWALAAVFALGVGGAVAWRALAGFDDADQARWLRALTDEAVTLVAVGAGLALLAGVARRRGFSELNGLMDGVVYGVAAGLGLSAGTAYAREAFLDRLPIVDAFGDTSLSSVGQVALSGLSHGLFGALIGAGLMAGRGSSRGRRLGYAAAGVGAAILLQAAYLWLAQDGALGSGGEARKWLALLVPLALVAGVAVVALTRERRALSTQLADEVARGVVRPDEAALLGSFVARRARYVRQLGRGDVDGWLALRVLHHRQVQLALVKHEANRSGRDCGSEADRLRAAVAAARAGFERADGPGRRTSS